MTLPVWQHHALRPLRRLRRQQRRQGLQTRFWLEDYSDYRVSSQARQKLQINCNCSLNYQLHMSNRMVTLCCSLQFGTEPPSHVFSFLVIVCSWLPEEWSKITAPQESASQKPATAADLLGHVEQDLSCLHASGDMGLRRTCAEGPTSLACRAIRWIERALAVNTPFDVQHNSSRAEFVLEGGEATESHLDLDRVAYKIFERKVDFENELTVLRALQRRAAHHANMVELVSWADNCIAALYATTLVTPCFRAWAVTVLAHGSRAATCFAAMHERSSICMAMNLTSRTREVHQHSLGWAGEGQTSRFRQIRNATARPSRGRIPQRWHSWVL